jgi:hypothetical protein
MMSLDFGRLRVDDDDDNHEETNVYRAESPTSFTKIITAASLVCLYLLNPFCMWTPRILSKEPASSIALWSIVAKTLQWIAMALSRGGGVHKGAGKNAEFLHIGPNNELWIYDLNPPGRQADTVISSTKTSKSVLTKVSQLTPLKAGY